MIDQPVFLDVNIPMYAAGAAHPARDACVWIMTQAATGNLVAAIDTEIIQEVLHRFGSMQQWALAVKLAAALQEVVPVTLPVLADDMRLTIDLCGRYGPLGAKARDLVHVAVMMNNDIKTIVTVDRHFDLIPEIARLDPLDLFSRRR